MPRACWQSCLAKSRLNSIRLNKNSRKCLNWSNMLLLLVSSNELNPIKHSFLFDDIFPAVWWLLLLLACSKNIFREQKDLPFSTPIFCRLYLNDFTFCIMLMLTNSTSSRTPINFFCFRANNTTRKKRVERIGVSAKFRENSKLSV